MRHCTAGPAPALRPTCPPRKYQASVQNRVMSAEQSRRPLPTELVVKFKAAATDCRQVARPSP